MNVGNNFMRWYPLNLDTFLENGKDVIIKKID
jgi:hypothetical protein